MTPENQNRKCGADQNAEDRPLPLEYSDRSGFLVIAILFVIIGFIVFKGAGGDQLEVPYQHARGRDDGRRYFPRRSWVRCVWWRGV